MKAIAGHWHSLKARPDARWLGMALVAVALAVLPFVLEASLTRTWVRIIDFALLYAMLAMGLNIVVGFAGLLDLGYIAFYAVGAYTYALLASPHFGLHLPFWLLLPLGALVAAIFGVLLGAPTLRLRGDYLAIVTLGFGEIIRIFLNNLNAPINITNGSQGVNRIDPISVGGMEFTRSQELLGITFPGTHLHYYLFLALAIAVMFICLRLEDSRIGRAWIAIREDEIAAQAMGINTRNVKLLAFAMGATFGGVAGGLFSAVQGFVSPESFGLLESIMVLCMVVLGGMGHVAGVVLGALLLATLPEVLRHTASPVQQQLFGHVILDPESLRMLLFGLALILVMLLRPAGLWPSPIRRRELTAAKAAPEKA
jgi:branched-chain amino acid transport system permease protein